MPAEDPCRPGAVRVRVGDAPYDNGPRATRRTGPVGPEPVRRPPHPGAGARGYFFLPLGSSLERTAMKASCGTSTDPTIFMRFFPSFCFSRSFRLREMSPP
ncbi:hypothetical protein GA0115257_108535 [Streptomyces sp. LcepLS]|nr:hypothetical protein GA0115257_108535 [Streptomyces sp. LcepLS]